MSRARNIKPGFFKNDRLAECDPLARILFAGLWCEADREGRLEDRPKRLKAEYLCYDNCDVDILLAQLYERGFIVRYGAGECKYIQIVAFKKHQNPHVKEGASTIPAPDKHGASTVLAGLIPDSPSLIPDSREKKKKAQARKPAAQVHLPSTAIAKPDDVDPQIWKDWLALRKAKRAPVTATVVAAAIGEAAKAGMTFEAFLRVWCARGSQGLQADWLKPNERAGPSKPSVAASFAGKIYTGTPDHELPDHLR